MPQIEQECEACHGFGVSWYPGVPGNTAAVCGDCKGTGRYVHTYTPFSGRKRSDDVKRVYDFWVLNSAVNHFRQPDPEKGVDYEEFLAGKMPPQ